VKIYLLEIGHVGYKKLRILISTMQTYLSDKTPPKSKKKLDIAK
jgi:hypothetical protein